MAQETKLVNAPANFKAAVWHHFAFKATKSELNVWETDKTHVICRKCTVSLKYSGNTTNMSTHLQRHHPEIYTSLGVKKRTNIDTSYEPKDPKSCASDAKKLSTLHMFGVGKKLPFNSTRAKSITTSIGKFIAKDLRHYSVVDNSGFKEMINNLEPQYTIPSRKTFSDNVIPELYEKTKADVLKCLDEVDSVSITTDGWTSIALQSYVTITVHYINKNWELCNRVLQTRMTEKSHTGENIAQELNSAFCEWNISDKIFALVTDNASNMKTAASTANIPNHLGCFAHTLNLAAQKAVKVPSITKSVAKIRNVIIYFRRSTTAFAVFKEKQKLLKLPNHKLKLDIVTRWNSTHDMIERYLEQQAAIQAALYSKDVRIKRDPSNSPLTDSDLSIAEDFIEVMKPLKKATEILSDEHKPTMSVIWPLHMQIMKNMEVNDNDSICVRQLKAAIHSDLSNRYTGAALVELLQKASALDPRFKELPLLDDVKRMKVYTDIAIEASMTQSLKQEPETSSGQSSEDSNLGSLPALPVLPEQSDIEQIDNIVSVQEESDSSGESPVKKIKTESGSSQSTCALDDFFGDVYITKEESGSKTKTKSKLDIANEEVSRYKTCRNMPMKENPLTWWKLNFDQFPLLACIARKYLAVPGTSVPSERIFSTAGDTVTSQRSSLKSEHVDKLIFLKKNLN